MRGWASRVGSRRSRALAEAWASCSRAMSQVRSAIFSAGRPCEIDFINGVAADYGRRVCRPATLNELIVSSVHEIERGERAITPDNLKIFEKYV